MDDKTFAHLHPATMNEVEFVEFDSDAGIVLLLGLLGIFTEPIFGGLLSTVCAILALVFVVRMVRTAWKVDDDGPEYAAADKPDGGRDDGGMAGSGTGR